VATTQTLYFASKFKISSYPTIIKNTKTVNHSYRPTHHFHHFIGIKIQIMFMSNETVEKPL
jgi:hypothetical protein